MASYLNQLPKDWICIEFQDFVKKSKKKHTPSSQQELRCLELEHIKQVDGGINGWVNSVYQKSTKNVFERNQILFGKLRPYLRKYWLADFDGVCSSEIWVLTTIDDEICTNEFLYRLIQSDRFIQSANVTSGTKMPRADWSYLSNFPFNLPPLKEQQKIAEILSQWDEAIETTQNLITQLQLRKKGLMQQLLSGKKRLAGFSEAWKERRLGEFIIDCKKKTIIQNEYEVLTSSNKGLLPQKEYFGNSRISDKSNIGFHILPPNHVTYRSGSDDGKFTFNLNELGYTGIISHYYPVFKMKNADNKFFIEYANMNKFQFGKYSVGTSQLVLSLNEIKRIRVSFPSVSEQKAISKIIALADLEIEEKKAYLLKLKQQKKGLMQQLLTGQKRVKID